MRCMSRPAAPASSQTGSAAFTIQLLQPPWKQVFSDEDEDAGGGPGHLRVTLDAEPGSRDELAAAVDVDELLALAGLRAGGERP